MSKTLFPRGLGGVIFDCDGVMINSRAANEQFYNRVLAYFDLPPMTPEQEAYSFMATAGQALRHIL
ncbi:HAD hydrolase-like protein, partial [uncultured Desulfovibrio sp.]